MTAETPCSTGVGALLSTFALSQEDGLAVVLTGKNGVFEPYTSRQLDADARRAARFLHSLGPETLSGEVAILELSLSRELLACYWGALYAGMVPAIVEPVRGAAAGQDPWDHVATLAQRSEARVLVTNRERSDLASLPGFNGSVLNPADIPESAGTSPPPEVSKPESIAYLQFTSGTSGRRKGVRLSHAAILNYVQAISARLQLGADDVVVNWLPLHHDFGLFMGLVMPAFCQIPAVLLSPVQCVRRPASFLGAIHRFGGTVGLTTNAGYHLFADGVRDRELENLDLSGLRLLLCGGEPILHRSQQAFLRRFSGCGLRETALVTGYGLAETTLAVTTSVPGVRPRVDFVDARSMHDEGRAVPSRDPTALPIVSSGFPLDTSEVKIIDADGSLLPDRVVGQIALRGDSLFSSYHLDPDATATALRNGWLLSGDLGYISEGELFVSGRGSDLMIIGGRNIHPEEIEAIAASERRAAGDRFVCFGVDDPKIGTQRAVLMCGMSRVADVTAHQSLEYRIRRKVLESVGVALADVRFVRRNWIVVTSNGKLRRDSNRKKYLAHFGAHWERSRRSSCFDEYAHSPSRETLLDGLTCAAKQLSGLSHIDPDENLANLGIDSLTLAQIAHALEEALGKEVSLEHVALRPTLGELARQATEQPQAPLPPPRLPPSKGVTYPPSRPRLKVGIRARLSGRLAGGPAFRGLAVPYAIGSRILEVVSGLRFIRERLRRDEIESLRACCAHLGDDRNIESILRQNLVANSWIYWRRHALKSAKTVEHWVEVRGGDILKRAFSTRTGVVLAVTHTRLKELIPNLPQLREREFVAIGNVGPDRLQDQGLHVLADAVLQREPLSQMAVYSAQLLRGGQVLRRGGVVMVAVDDDVGVGGIIVSFHGRQRVFRPGAAELALDNGAAFIPVFASIDPGGRIEFEFCRPLTAEEPTHPQRVEGLLRQYAHLLAERFGQQLGSLQPYILKKFLSLPEVS